MEISRKEWLTVLGIIDRLRWTSDMHGTMLTVLLHKLEQMEALSASQREAIEAEWDKVYRMAEQEEVLAQEPRDPKAERRVFLTNAGVVAAPPESCADRLEMDFEKIMARAIEQYRTEQGEEG